MGEDNWVTIIKTVIEVGIHPQEHEHDHKTRTAHENKEDEPHGEKEEGKGKRELEIEVERKPETRTTTRAAKRKNITRCGNSKVQKETQDKKYDGDRTS